MLETLSVHPRICDQVRSGPLGRWIDDFVDVHMTRGYATSTLRRHVRAAAIFSVWLDQQHVAAADVDETLVTRFVTRLPRRPSLTRPSGLPSNVASGVRLLAAHLWSRGVAARSVLAFCGGAGALRGRAGRQVGRHRLIAVLQSCCGYCQESVAVLPALARARHQRHPGGSRCTF